MKGVGLFGGTFNPIHMGHLRVAEEVKSGFGLERIYFIPSAIPPHKEISGLANAQDRFQMLAEAIYPNPHFVASDVELNRDGRSYTIDTVIYYKSILGQDIPCYLIVGSDAFLEINTWKSFRELFDLIPFIVMKRPSGDNETHTFFTALADFINSSITDGYELSGDGSCFQHACKQPIYLFDVTPLKISSTKIRDLAQQGNSIKYLVPDPVEKYILIKGLYK